MISGGCGRSSGSPLVQVVSCNPFFKLVKLSVVKRFFIFLLLGLKQLRIIICNLSIKALRRY